MKIDIKTGLPELPQGFVWVVEEDSKMFYSDLFGRNPAMQLVYTLSLVNKVQDRVLSREVITRPAIDEEIASLKAMVEEAHKEYSGAEYAYRKSSFRKKKLRAIRDNAFDLHVSRELKLLSLKKSAPSVPLSKSDILAKAVVMSNEQSKFLGEVVAKSVSAHLVGEYPPLSLGVASSVEEV